MPDDETPREGKYIDVFFPEGFLQEAAKRGVEPGHLMSRLMDLHVQADKEGRELFDDWDQWPQEKQLRWCLDVGRERVRLEFPYLDDEGEQAGE